MTNLITIDPVEAPGDAGEPDSSEGEPPRTCAEILAEDERWEQVPGLWDFIPELVAAALTRAGLDPESRNVSIALLSGTEVQSLNKAFRGKDSPTNVLSFPAAPAPLGSPGPHFLGDVALSYDTVIEEAAAQNKSTLNHAAHLVVHGVLHLAGLDHGNDADAEQMEEAERLILAQYGIPDPYREDAPTVPAEH